MSGRPLCDSHLQEMNFDECDQTSVCQTMQRQYLSVTITSRITLNVRVTSPAVRESQWSHTKCLILKEISRNVSVGKSKKYETSKMFQRPLIFHRHERRDLTPWMFLYISPKILMNVDVWQHSQLEIWGSDALKHIKHKQLSGFSSLLYRCHMSGDAYRVPRFFHLLCSGKHLDVEEAINV